MQSEIKNDELPELEQVVTRSDDDEGESEDEDYIQNVNMFENIQEKIFDILENEEVEDVVDLNEKFLS